MNIQRKTTHDPYQLRQAVEQARHATDGREGGSFSDFQELNAAMALRRDFWADTCQEVTKMHVGWPEVLALYSQHGCRFCAPTQEQVQEVLDALDSALPTWDRDHPELFYQTLELNFPELMRSH